MHSDLPTQSLIAANVAVLRQGQDLLARLDDQRYTATAAPLFAYGVGSHMRHCLDAYRCFLRDLHAGQIDYDRRDRDARIERERGAASALIAEIIARLEALPDATMNAALAGTLLSRQDSPHWVASSAQRELQFLLSHTVHHYALVAVLLRVQGFAPAADFGVAPATLEYWRQANGPRNVRQPVRLPSSVGRRTACPAPLTG